METQQSKSEAKQKKAIPKQTTGKNLMEVKVSNIKITSTAPSIIFGSVAAKT